MRGWTLLNHVRNAESCRTLQPCVRCGCPARLKLKHEGGYDLENNSLQKFRVDGMVPYGILVWRLHVSLTPVCQEMRVLMGWTQVLRVLISCWWVGGGFTQRQHFEFRVDMPSFSVTGIMIDPSYGRAHDVQTAIQRSGLLFGVGSARIRAISTTWRYRSPIKKPQRIWRNTLRI